ncbi:nucleotidyltransferase family protein [Ramlibacter algicola]|uniref:Nucleotidyltransferase family protein n=1 Tax=Ramlibacter algicola TaxID=2795217 RepID=A0A934Q2A9_9BURK|nr:nucleotidyltransferase family protein [Ramlibacter algicola]MBK0393750.1 nucleotidyltransferase family protein [Ramlibacter algicola]
MPIPAPDDARFLEDILANRCNRAILDAWEALELEDGWLVAGCLFQTIWNLRDGRAPGHGIKDYDIFYFDAADLSVAGEARVQQRVDRVLGPLGVPVEVKNQARVHLWYEEHFGYPYPQLASAKEGIDRFLIPSTCVGVRWLGGRHELYVPNGLSILYAGVLTPNPLTCHLPLFREKAASYKSRWEWLQVCEEA